MNPKDQATQQSLQNLNNISAAISNKEPTWFKNYWQQGVDLPTFTEKEDFGKPLAQFSNFLIRDVIGGTISAPANVYQGSLDISQGNYYSGAGKILKGGLDLASVIPLVRGATVVGKVAKAARAGETVAPTLLKTAGKEALIQGGYGAGYGLSTGLIEAQNLAPDQRLGTIAKQTGIGAGIGAGIGFATPYAGAAIGKGIKALRKEEVLATDALDKKVASIAKQNREEVTPTPITQPTKPKVQVSKTISQDAINTIRKESTENVVKNISKSQKRNLAKEVVKNIGEENLPKITGAAQDVKDDVLLNVRSGNIDGAKAILNQASDSDKKAASQWFISLANKGDVSPEQRQILLDVIQDGNNPDYFVNPSLQKTQAAIQIASTQSRENIAEVLQRLVNIKQLVDKEIRDGVITPQQREGRIARYIITKFDDLLPTDVVDTFQPYINIALNEPGLGGLAKEAAETLSRFGTGQGQSTQPFANYVTPSKVVDEALTIVQDVFKKVDPETTQQIKNTAGGMVSETVQATDEILASPQVAKELSDLGQDLLDNVEESITGVASKPRKTKSAQEEVVDYVETEINKIVDTPYTTAAQKDKAKEVISQTKKIYKEELNKLDKVLNAEKNNDKPYTTMEFVLKSKPNLEELVNKVRPQIDELFLDDGTKRTFIDELVKRQIGQPYTDGQFNSFFNAIKRDYKISFKDLSLLDDAQLEAFKQDLRGKLAYKMKLAGSKQIEEAKDLMFNKLFTKFDAEVNRVKAKVKQPYEIVAEKAINSIRKPTTGSRLDTSEQKMYASLVKQLSIILSDTKKETLGAGIKPGVDYSNFVFMLKNQKEYAGQWNKAKQKVIEEIGNDPLAVQQLENFFQRNVPEVFTERQAQKIAFDQMRKNGYRFNEIVRMSGITRASKREDIIASLMLDLKGLTAEEAAPIADAVMKFVRDKTESSRKEILQRYIDRLGLTPAQKKTAEQKLLELHNLGIFDDANVANQLFSVKDLPSISPDDVQFINETLMLAQLPKGAERAIDIRTAYRLIGERLAESNKFKLDNWRDITTAFDAYYYNNIFSSIQTQERNILGGLINAFVVKPSIVLGEAIASVFLKDPVGGARFSDVADYYKSAFGSVLSGKAWNNFKNVWSPEYYQRLENESIDAFYREARKKGLPPIMTQVGKFMEASDQFVSTIIESGTSTVLQKRGISAEEAAQQGFLEAQKFLGKSNFGKEGWREVGVVDAFFDRIGNFGTAVKGRNDAWNFVMTPLVPVLRLAVNFQKLKSKLFLPTQLLNMMTKKSRNMEDYAYLSISTALFGLAIDKYLKNEVAFEPPKDEAGRRLFFDSGRKPYSVKIGENWVPLQYLELFGAPFLFMGAVNAAYREDPNALTNSEVDKLGVLMQKFVKSYLVSPTYLNNIANAIEAVNGVNGKDWGNAVAYPVTGLIPFVGLYRDILDVLDPVRRKKSSAWDEFNALYLPLRQQMETYKTTDLQDVPLSTTEIYAPYGIGVANQKFDNDYIRTIQTKQFGRQYIKDIEEDKKGIESAKEQLFVAINTQDYAKAREIIIVNKLTPEQVSAVTQKFNEKDITKNFTPQQLALYNMSATDLELLGQRKTELQGQINKALEIKKNFESGKKSLYDELKDLNRQTKPKKPRKIRAKKARAKKVRAKKFKIQKPKPIKKLKAIKTQKV
jgi:hypothetical protein